MMEQLRRRASGEVREEDGQTGLERGIAKGEWTWKIALSLFLRALARTAARVMVHGEPGKVQT